MEATVIFEILPAATISTEILEHSEFIPFPMSDPSELYKDSKKKKSIQSKYSESS